MAAIALTSTVARSGFADDTQSRASAEVRIVGRLDARPRVLRETTQTTIVGVLTDEAGLPVAGEVEPLAPSRTEFASCLPHSKGAPNPAFPVDESGRFCLRTAALDDDARVVLRLSAKGHRARELEIPVGGRAAAPPRLLTAPEIIDLDATAASEVTATTDALSDDQPAELRVDCAGESTTVATGKISSGQVRFEVAPGRLPGPGACTFIVRAGSDSAPRPVVLQGRATLTSLGWTRAAGRSRAIVRARLRWQGHERPLEVGVLEGSVDAEHLFTAPLSARGEGRLDFDEPPTSPITLRLTRAPLYVLAPEPLTLAPPVPWQGWRALQALGLLGLGVWLMLSWRGAEKKPEPVIAEAAVRSAPPPRGSSSGRVLDTHTGQPIAAEVRIFTVGPTSEELVASCRSGADGIFHFERHPGITRFRATADGYVDLEGSLPAGAAAIRMVGRRRAALSLLTSWFRGKTPQGPVPTPQEVRRAALSGGRSGVAEWAEEVARAAYAAAPPSDADLSALAERKPS